MGKKITELSLSMNSSNWSIGSNDKRGPTRWRTVTELSYPRPQGSERSEPAFVKGFGNSSRMENIFGLNRPLENHYVSRTKETISEASSASSSAYHREGPAFDRLSACRTNYELGNGKYICDYKSQTMRETPNPKSVPPAAVPNFKPRQDLGYNFAGVAFDGRTVPKKTPGYKTMYDRPAEEPRLGCTYNIVRGREEPKFRAPPRESGARRRPKLNSLATLRPHTPESGKR